MPETKKTITIPGTTNVLKPYLAIYGAVYDGTKSFSATELLQVPLVEIGAVRKFGYTNDRGEIKYYRIFGENENGKIKETYPSLADYVLVFDTVLLYENSFFEQFGFDPTDIMFQDQPAIIQIVRKAPTGIETKVITFGGVWFQNNPVEWEADADDLLISQEINAKASIAIP